MQDVIELAGCDSMKFEAAPTIHQMPLTFLKNGEEARVLKVRGKGDVQD